MLKFLKDLAVILLIVLVLFALVNWAAWWYLARPEQNNRGWEAGWQVSPVSPRGIAIRKKVFATDDEAWLRLLETEPGLRAHTVLHFTNGFSTPVYTVGLQGMRYAPGETDTSVQAMLESEDSVYVFGGSTTFGHGVADDGTLVGYLDAGDTAHRYLNFGVNAYDSQRELDKLLYLLRQGYRPAAVVFVDGLNDITTFMSTPHRAHDKPRTQGFLIDRGRPALVFGAPAFRNMLLALAYAMPVTHLYHRLTESDPAVPYGTLDANTAALDYGVLSYYYRNQFTYAEANLDGIIADWLAYYRGHVDFVQQLGEAYGFSVHFVLQPFGVLDTGNPFLNPDYFDSSGIVIARRYTAAVRAEINAGRLGMIDCLDAFRGGDSSMLYVDATHYSPLGNQMLAGCIASGIAAAAERQRD